MWLFSIIVIIYAWNSDGYKSPKPTKQMENNTLAYSLD
jgi:hypothetical protein